MTRFFLHTPRAVIALILLGVCFVLGIPTLAQEDLTYLYYFESDDANLIDTTSKEYAFSTLRGERVTIVVYGLDQLITPRLTVFNAAGTQIGTGRVPPEQPFVSFYQLNAAGNDLFTFRVESVDGEGGLARVMLFEGDPLNQDLTLLDDMNPLLPSRAFMVAGRDNEEGLRVLVEVLDVPYYDSRPQVFASRSTLNDLPDVTERFNPSDTFLWFNRDIQEIYFVNIRPTPEESTIVTEDIPLPSFNVGNFFYFDYYFTVGAGSDPIRLVTRQDCTNAPNRIECVRESPSLGRTEISAPPVPSLLPVESVDIFRPDRDALPPVQDCIGGFGVNLFFVNPTTYTGTSCDDFLSGSEGIDSLAGGPGDDTILGNGGNDIIFGDEGNDSLNGGAGNDFIDGGLGDDFLIGGPGNDTLEGGLGIDTVSYTDAGSAVTIDLTNHTNPALGGTAVSVTEGNDILFNIETIWASEFNDSITGSANNDTLFGFGGNDTLFGNGGSDIIHAGAGDDEVRIGSPVLGTSYITLGSGNDLVVINGPGSAVINGGDSTGLIANDGNDTFRFFDTAAGTFELFSQWGDDEINFSNLTSGVTFSLSSLLMQNPVGALFIQLADDSINRLIGTAFNDVLTGSTNNKNCDFIDAGAGNDLVFATASNGFDCAAQDSTLTNDVLIGGAGNDTLSYVLLNDVDVDLSAGTAIKNGFMFDTISDFENVFGSIGNDTITGDGNANILAGGFGNDIVNGGGGNDTILAGLGSDTIDGGTGVDLVDFSGALGGREIRLDGVAADDLITNVEDVIGTNFGDIIWGSSADNVIDAGGGNDVIVVADDAFGNDNVTGGAGRDTLNASLSTKDTNVTINADSGTLVNSDGTVTYNTVEAVWTGSGNDSFQINMGLPDILAPLIINGGLGDNTYNFNVLATGYIQITPNVIDTLTVDNAAAPGFSGLIVGVWQQLLTDLYVLLTSPINPSCGALGETVFINATFGDDVIGGAPLNLTSCPSNDVFNGLGGFDTITYETVPLTVGDLLVTIANGLANQVATVSSTSGDIGNDTIIDFDRIVGRAGGRDIFRFDPLTSLITVQIDGNGGNDSLDFSAISTSVVINLGSVASQNVYTNLNLSLITPIRDVLLGTGNDTLIGSSGDDTIDGNAGNDSIMGGLGNDVIRGGLGNDTVFGEGGNDLFIETAADGGNDSYNGGDGDDTFQMVLDGFTDFYVGGNGYDLFQYMNNTPVTGTIGSFSTIIDGGGADILSGIEEIVTGGGNDNLLLDGGGISVLRTGDGNDTVTANGTASTPLIYLEGGDDVFISAAPSSTSITVDGGTGSNSATVNHGGFLFANVNANTITTNDFSSMDTYLNFATLIFGGVGTEYLTVANDSFVSSISLGAGDDSLFVQLDTAANVYDGGAGTDGIDYSALLGALTLVLDTDTTVGNDTVRNFELLVLGNANYTITEEAGSPFTTLTTGTGTDVITLNGDNLTTLNTGAGNDSVTVAAFNINTTINMAGGVDSLTYDTGAAALTVAINGLLSGTVSNGVVTDTFNGVELLTLAGGADTININANGGGIAVNAGAGADVFNVGVFAANASLLGGAGNDTFNLAFGGSALVFNGGADVDTASYTTNADTTDVFINGASVVVDNLGLGISHLLSDFEVLLLGTGVDFVFSSDDSVIQLVDLGGGNDFLSVSSITTATTYDGGTGTDVANYSLIGGDLTITLDTDTTINLHTIRNFESLVLGNANYTITEEAGSPFTTFTTGAGNDTFTLNGDNLTSLNTGSGSDSVNVAAFNTNTTITMGAGNDSLTYTAADAVTVAISGALSGTVSNGLVTDTFSGVELLTLGGTADTININTSGGGIVVNAGAGADVFNVGSAASDATLEGGAGNDTFLLEFGGSGLVFDGGADVDTAAYNSQIFETETYINAGVITIIDYDTFSVHTLNNFEELLLGSSSDYVFSNDDSLIQLVDLRSGNDFLWVTSVTAATTYDGGSGFDVANYSGVAGDLTITLDTDTTIGLDTIRNFESLVLGNDNYTITEQAGNPFSTLTTGGGSDIVTLNADTISTLNTGGGNDSVNVAAFNTNTTINMGAGNDSLTYTAADAVTVAISGALSGTVSNGVVTDSFSGVELLTLAGTADTINLNANGGGIEVNAGGGADTFNVGAAAANATLRGGAGDDSFVITFGAGTGLVFDGGAGGTDTADYSGTAAALSVTINATGATVGTQVLNNFEVLLLGSGADTVTVVNDAGLPAINLGAGNDTLVVQLNAAANIFDGGTGSNTADYSAIAGNLSLTLDTNTTVGLDTLINFQQLVLGNANYNITEQAGSTFTTFTTGTGDDTFTLNGDNLTSLNTGAGDDSVNVAAFNTNTTINMGAGDDSLTYTAADAVTVAISGALSGTVSNGVVTDSFSGVELLTLGGTADTINVNANGGGIEVNAGGGADTFNVGAAAANATLRGGAGDDSFVIAFGAGTGLVFDGGTGTDTADYSGTAAALSVTINATGATVGTQVLNNFEVLLLGSGADTVTVVDDAGLPAINLGAGNDTLVVQLNAAANIFDGGTGSNTADYSAIAGNLSLTLDTNTTVGLDTLINFQQLVLGNANYNITEQAGSTFTTFTTGTGDDTFTLNGDNFTSLNTGAGEDSVVVNAMNTDTAIDLGADDDELVYATGAADALTVSLGAGLTGTVTDGVTTDTFSGVELLTLDDAADIIGLNVNAGGIEVNAGGGADTFNVGATAANATLRGGAGDDSFVIAFGAGTGLVFDGGTGTDTADYSANAGVLTVTIDTVTTVGTQDLENFEILLLGDGNNTITVADDAGIETIVMGSGDDTLIVEVDTGANTFDGGAGIDSADYSLIVGDLVIVLDTTTTVGNDELINFESLTLGNADYTITEQAGSTFTTFATGAGDDTFTLNGDNLTSLNTGAGEDSVIVNTMNTDTSIDLGADDDELVYATGAADALTVSLGAGLTGTVTDGVTTDTFSGVELLALDDAADIIGLNVNAGGIEVNAGGGADTFNVGATAANATLRGGAGDDSFVIAFGAGAGLVFDGGAGGNDIADYSSTVAALTVSVNTTITVGTQSLTNFEILTLGTGADAVTIAGDTVPLTINLGNGADIVTIASPTFTGGSTYNGGGGADTLAVATTAGTVNTASLAGGALTLNGTAAYNFTGIETIDLLKNVTGTITVNNPTGVTTLNTSASNDILTVTNSGSLTAINTGAGQDSINVVSANPATLINSGAGDDIFVITMDTNDNIFDGGADFDTANYATANPTTDLNVNVGVNATVSNGVNTDTLNNFEAITTGGGNDVFTIDLSAIVGTWNFNAGGSTSGNQFVFTGSGAGTNTAQINIFTSSGGLDTLDFSAVLGSGVTLNTGNTTGTQQFVTNTNLTIWLHNTIQNVVGSQQNDNLTGSAQNDVILGLGGNDVINGGDGNDTLVGGAGNDTLNGNAGADLLIGDHRAVGSGSQTVGAGGTDVIVGGAGNDTVIGGSLVDCQSAPASVGTAGADGADTLYGGSGADSIQGDNLIQNCTTIVDGGGGADSIFGGANVGGVNDGNDTITGGPGADTIYGGNAVGGNQAGNDSILIQGDGANDTAYGGNAAPGGSAGTNTFVADPGDTTVNGNAP